MAGSNGDPRDSATMQAGMIQKALARFYDRKPEIPSDLHEDLATIFAAAQAHHAYLIARTWIGEAREES